MENCLVSCCRTEIIVVTSLCWATFWSFSVPSTIMLAFPGVCTIQLVSIITGVVSCRGVGVTSHPDFTILGSIEFRTVVYRNFLWPRWLMNELYSSLLATYFSLLGGILEPFRTKYHRAGIFLSVSHPGRIHSCRYSKLLKSRSSLSQRPCHTSVQ